MGSSPRKLVGIPFEAELSRSTEPHQVRTCEVLRILVAAGFPLGPGTEFRTPLRCARLAHILLGVANLRPDQSLADLSVLGVNNYSAPRSRDLIRFVNTHYGESIADSSYDDVRRKNLDFLVEAGLVVKSANKTGAATNDGTRGYAISPEAAMLFKSFGTRTWKAAVSKWVSEFGSLSEKLSRSRIQPMVPVLLPNGQAVSLSLGKHNVLQKAVVEDFLPRFLKEPELLYLGDTAKKILIYEEAVLAEIGLKAFDHDTLPDVVVLDRKTKWLYFIEAVHSSNPINRLRHLALERMSAGCKFGKVYVSAFLSRDEFRKWVADLSWETEVWIADAPDHMIHFNGDRFLGPHY